MVTINTFCLRIRELQSRFTLLQRRFAVDAAEMVRVTVDMPDARYANLWDSIVVDSSIKDRLLRSAALSLRLRAELPFETTALHGLALLYGPPGTGKTTLARGLAHQLAPLTT